MADKNRLHWETVSPLLKEALGILMAEKIFAPFRLVGGTNLSLRYGHRLSVDIDLFTDTEYGSRLSYIREVSARTFSLLRM